MAPAAGDIVFDICEMVTFGFFVIDMTLRIFVEPNYFDIRWCCRGGSEGGHCSLGSFMFWCDLASTGVILYDVSFINKARYQIVDVEIELEDGMQVSRLIDIVSDITVWGRAMCNKEVQTLFAG